MSQYIHVSYPGRTEKFNICKNYGLDKDLLDILPTELWLKIFGILHEEALIIYKNLVGCEMEYNIHRLFKKRKYECIYRDFQIKIKVSPGMYQFYSTMYNEKDIREYYGYTTYICHDELKMIEEISDYAERFHKCKCLGQGLSSKDCWGISLTTDYDNDLVFTEGFNCERIINKLKNHKRDGKIKTFKTIEYYEWFCKGIIDNFYSKKNRIRNFY